MKTYTNRVCTILLTLVTTYTFGQQIISETQAIIPAFKSNEFFYTEIGHIGDNYYHTKQTNMAPHTIVRFVDGKEVKSLKQKYEENGVQYLLKDLRVDGDQIKGIAHVGDFFENEWKTYAFTLDKDLNFVEKPTFITKIKTAKDLGVQEIKTASSDSRSEFTAKSQNKRYEFISESKADRSRSIAYYYVYDNHTGRVIAHYGRTLTNKEYFEQSIPISMLNNGEMYLLHQEADLIKSGLGSYTANGRQKTFLVAPEQNEKIALEDLELHSKYEKINAIIALDNLTPEEEQVFLTYSSDNKKGNITLYKMNLENSNVKVREHELVAKLDNLHTHGVVVKTQIFEDGRILVVLSQQYYNGPFNILIFNPEGDLIYNENFLHKSWYTTDKLEGLITYVDKQNKIHLLFNTRVSNVKDNKLVYVSTSVAINSSNMTTVDLAIDTDKNQHSLKTIKHPNSKKGGFLLNLGNCLDGNSLYEMPVIMDKTIKYVTVDFAK